MAKRDRANKKLTERIYKVPCCVQDTIPISRISENGIFELENKKGVRLFDKVYLFEDINFPRRMRATKIRRWKNLRNC